MASDLELYDLELYDLELYDLELYDLEAWPQGAKTTRRQSSLLCLNMA